MSTPIYTPLSPEAQRFINDLTDLGYLNKKQRHLFFERSLKKDNQEAFSLQETRRALALFLLEEKDNLSAAQQEMLQREWNLLFS